MRAAFLAPLAFGPEAAGDRESAFLGAIGRLKSGISLERAGRELPAPAFRLHAGRDVTAVAMELERQGKSPVLWFERVGERPAVREGVE